VNPGAERRIDDVIPVLDQGFVVLRDYLGNDESVVSAARVSYDRGVGDEEDTRRLINFLMRERHTSPFEQCVLTFDIKAPIFVFRELVRHRTLRLNEISGRYAELAEEYYVPTLDRVRVQSKTNKQGSGEPVSPEAAEMFLDRTRDISSQAFDGYHHSLNQEVARELARITLPLNTYSRMRVQCDLHNLLHFTKLRTAQGAQWEIRQFAHAISSIIRESFPMTWDAFEEHVLEAVTLSKTERETLNTYLSSGTLTGIVKVDPVLQRIANKVRKTT
jgi:thymidylate synthase (FAD)